MFKVEVSPKLEKGIDLCEVINNSKGVGRKTDTEVALLHADQLDKKIALQGVERCFRG